MRPVTRECPVSVGATLKRREVCEGTLTGKAGGLGSGGCRGQCWALHAGPLRTELGQPAASGDRSCDRLGSLDTWQVYVERTISLELGHWIPESLRYRTKETHLLRTLSSAGPGAAASERCRGNTACKDPGPREQCQQEGGSFLGKVERWCVCGGWGGEGT